MKHTTTHNKHMLIDMDNTLCALKNVPDVWHKLDTYDVTPYVIAQPIQHSIDVVKHYAQCGYTIHIVTWLSKITNDTFDMQTYVAKMNWLKQYMGDVDITSIHIIPYGTNKNQYIINDDILFDDDVGVLTQWNGVGMYAMM